MKPILIVGAGLFGSVLAERIAADAGLPVTVIDRRAHPGGNCWSEIDGPTGVEVHKYGSHIFHTSDENVWRYVTRFTDFNQYRHTVWTISNGQAYSMPINLGTINAFFRKSFSPAEAAAHIRAEIAREGLADPANLEEKAVSLIGRSLYTAFIRGYTIKQWEKDPTELSPEIITRLPVRFTYNNRYFSDAHEGIPLQGYAALFRNLLRHPRIRLLLDTDYQDVAARHADALICCTGAVDAFFDYRLGRLEWRTVDFERQYHDCPDFQGTAVMNYADAETPWTRVHEYKHYHPERPATPATVVFREYSRAAGQDDEPYYPVDTQPNRDLLRRYQDLARQTAPNVIFGGRLGAYRYYDMDDTIAAALRCYEHEVLPRLRAAQA